VLSVYAYVKDAFGQMASQNQLKENFKKGVLEAQYMKSS